MNCTSSGETTTRLCLVLVASPPPEQGERQARVWDFDSGELSEPQGLAISRGGRCEHCGGEGEPMLRVLHGERLLAFCDRPECVVTVGQLVSFAAEYEHFEAETGATIHVGFCRCVCGRSHIVGGPEGNWTLAYCQCGQGLLARPELADALRAAS